MTEPADPTVVTLSVPGISCGHCQRSIEGAVRPLDGVRTADVDVEGRTVLLHLDGPHVMPAVVAAIEDVGFEVPAPPPGS